MFIKFLRKLFKVHSPSKEWTKVPYVYHELDTKCDLCDFKSDCYSNLIETTRDEDTRRHFIKMLGYDCPLEISSCDIYK